MKVSIEYHVIGSKKKYPDVASEVFVPDDWSDDKIKEWYAEKHKNICGLGVEVITIERIND